MTVKELADVMSRRIFFAMYEDENGSITQKDIISLSNKADRAFLEMHATNYIIEFIETDEDNTDLLYIQYRKEK